MYKIQTLNKISPVGLTNLPLDNYEVSSEPSNPDAILLRSYKMHDMELPSSVKAIGRAGAGTNNIPIDKYAEMGVVVFNTPGANANAVKELVMASLFVSSRNVIGGVNWVQGLLGKGEEVPKLVEGGKSQFVGPEILGKKLGVIGLGAVGVNVCNSATSLGMEVIGFDPFLSVDAAWGLSRAVKKANSLDDLLSQVDYLSIHVPLNEHTKNLINSEKIKLMKDTAKIINFARGGLVNDDAILEAIKNNKIGGYVTDFPNEKMLGVDGIIPVPHLGASSPEAENNCATMAVNEIKDFLENGNIVNSVNFPACSMAKSGATRITIVNKNIPNMVGQITTVLADNSVNISDLMNKHRNDIAYNIIDVDGDVSDATVTALEGIEGVIKVRLIK